MLLSQLIEEKANKVIEILAAAIPTPSLAGKTVTGGRLDVSGF